ncbi:uncharacterized protein LOC112084494 [Eutrema salsugineum]|uniref:uncharacterized protein LOC112084494 n=1 Tax=Eutrema salsugineum TaxID=72664 RepID=UPI000CED79FF|nr:uncharacterized protein LOC112084494 [Eutrema salsugineum]
MGILLSKFGARGCVDLGILHTATVEEALLTHRRRRHQHSDLNEVEEALEVVKRDYRASESDLFLWKSKEDTFKERFSARDTRHLLLSFPRVSWLEGIWFKYHSPKTGFIAWLAIRSRLSTGDRMQHWVPQFSVSCVF